MKLGIYGGTFDPIHTGHLILAESVHSQLKLDKILFIPAAIPPHKMESSIMPPDIRYEMLQLAIADNPYFQASAIEIERTGVSFTINTIKTIGEQMHLEREEIFFILGADNILGFPSWYQPDEILASCQIVVLPRPEVDLNLIHPMLQNKIIIVKTPLIDISSSMIRQFIKQNRSVRYLVPDPVFYYIQKNQLYQSS